MLENWIDNLAKACGTVYAGKNRLMKAYRQYEVNETPEAITQYPCCIQLPQSVRLSYSSGGVCTAIWTGTTEFHLAPNLGRKALPEVLLFYDRIFRAFAANITLYGSVAQCILDPDGPSIEGPMEMRWGSEDFHFGMIAHWTVKEILTSVTVS